MLPALARRRDYQQIANLTHGMLNLAAFKDASGEEEQSKAIHKGLRKALNRLATDNRSFFEVLQLTEGGQ